MCTPKIIENNRKGICLLTPNIFGVTYMNSRLDFRVIKGIQEFLFYFEGLDHLSARPFPSFLVATSRLRPAREMMSRLVEDLSNSLV